jgi:hypothetical protein
MMKFCKVTLFFALLVAFCLPVVAQTSMRVDIPFTFIAGGKSLPAGRYTVAPALNSNHTAWRISNDHAAVMVLSDAIESQQAHRHGLVFLRTGGAYSLTEIWNEGHFGRETLKSNVKQTLVAKGGKYVDIGAE